jgi:hypothetical protein
MIGLLVLGTLVLWFFVARGIARRLARAVPMKAAVRPWASVGLFVVVFLLPVADELAAKPYFAVKCHRAAVLRVDAGRIKGRTVKAIALINNERIGGTPIPIFHSRVGYVDATTGEALANYDTFEGGGGALGRFIGFPPSHSLTGTFYCAPSDLEEAREKYGFSKLH